MNRHIACLLLLALLLLAGCREERTLRIGVSQCSRDDWREKMNDEIHREIMFHPEATVEIRSADDSNEKQIADIRYFHDNGFDIIIAAPNEADAITPVIKEVYESGTPVIVFDRNIHGEHYTAYQGVDNEGIGSAAAQYAATLTGRGGKVLEIYGLPGSTPADGRHNGFARRASELGLETIATGYGNWNYDAAARATDSLLDIYADIDLIYAHNDRMAIAASETARAHGRDIRVIGIDAAPEIGIQAVADSIIDATFLYPTEGYKLVRTALAILQGRPYERTSILPLASAIDRTNADIFLLQNEQLKEETAKIRQLKAQVDEYWNRHSAQTMLFYAVIAILVLLAGILFMILRAFWQHRRHQKTLLEQNRLLAQQRDTEKALNEQLSEATQSKLMFFTNVSHDLRTPLTLIAEPVAQLAQADNLTPQQHTLITIAHKNVKILQRLINQILDFRKFENGKLDLHLSETPLAAVMDEWMESFAEAAHRRDMHLTSSIDLPEGFTTAIDTEKMERVFFNLMSNAFKYTRDNGRIHLHAALSPEGNLVFSISDTGIGIAPADCASIFDRFFQVDKVRPRGSGIGLSLTKAFIELHGGTIAVESTPGAGSTFTVTLPVRHISNPLQQDKPARTISDSDISLMLTDIDHDSGMQGSDKPLLLVVDDNDDIRTLVREILGTSWRIIEAPDGKEGLRLASRYTPDLIICDVMMPVMDGLECCRRIKSEITTSHIPVLLLTACSRDEERTRGYEYGADGYLSKPFSSDMLRTRCQNLIDNRRRIHDIAPAPAAEPPATPDLENTFYARVLEIIGREMSNPDLSVDTLAERAGMGRSQFYRKIKALTNYSPVELLRQLRVKKARELLIATDRSISEIAYEVGFTSPAYFTKCYRELQGETPSAVRERLGHK